MLDYWTRLLINTILTIGNFLVVYQFNRSNCKHFQMPVLLFGCLSDEYVMLLWLNTTQLNLFCILVNIPVDMMGENVVGFGCLTACHLLCCGHGMLYVKFSCYSDFLF